MEKTLHNLAETYDSFAVFKDNPLKNSPISFKFFFFFHYNFLNIIENKSFADKASVIISNAVMSISLLSVVEDMSSSTEIGVVALILHSVGVDITEEQAENGMPLFISIKKCTVSKNDIISEQALLESHFNYLNSPVLKPEEIN
jgi:hypothetical protein